jgi:hypothetical protein
MDRIYTFENADEFRNKLVTLLKFPFVSCSISTLGGRENVSCIVTISKDKRETWYNGYIENSVYARLHVFQDGTVKQFSGHGLKLRQFTGKSVLHMAKKINQVKTI